MADPPFLDVVPIRFTIAEPDGPEVVLVLRLLLGVVVIACALVVLLRTEY